LNGPRARAAVRPGGSLLPLKQAMDTASAARRDVAPQKAPVTPCY